MKDSRVGAYGVIGLVLLFILKMVLLRELISFHEIPIVLLTFVAVHAISRFMAATFVFTDAYVRDTPDSKAKPIAKKTNINNLILAFIFGVAPLLFVAYLLNNYLVFVIVPVLYLFKIRLGIYFRKWIGGYTGDCLGAAQQIMEVSSYALIILVWKFI